MATCTFSWPDVLLDLTLGVRALLAAVQGVGLQLEAVFRAVESAAGVVTEVAAEGVAGGMVDSVAEVVAEHAAEGDASEGAAEAATEGGAAEAAAGGAGNGDVTKPAVTVNPAVVELEGVITMGLVSVVLPGILAGILAGLLIEYCGGPEINTLEAGACGAAFAVGTHVGNFVFGGGVVTRRDGPSIASRCGTRWSVVPRGVRRGPHAG